jgi:phosphate acetyltransferase
MNWMSGAIIDKPIGQGMNMDEFACKKHEKYERLIATAKRAPPPMVAVAHPCDQSSLEGAVDAARLGLIEPILVGPAARIRQVAAEFNLDISALPIVETEHSHASAQRAVELVREGKAEALMKGSLHTMSC